MGRSDRAWPRRTRPAIAAAFAGALAVVLLAAATAGPRPEQAAAATGPQGEARAAAGGAQRETAVERIVSLVPAATEMLFAMGAGESVVGVSSYDTWPPEVRTLPKLGGLLDPDEERILRLQPDVAILDAGQRTLARRLEAAGIVSYPFPHADLETAFEAMERIGDAIGRSAAGAALASGVRDELEMLRRAKTGPPVRALIVFGRSPGSFQSLWVIGGGGFTSELLEIAGGENVFGDVELRSFKVGLEAVLTRAPRVVIELRPARGRVVDADALAAEWRSLPGLGRLHVAVLTDDAMLVPGPRMPRTVRLLAAELHERRR